VRDIVKLGVTLALICAIAAGGLALTYAATKDEIARQLEKRQLNAYRIVFRIIRKPVFKHRVDLARELKEQEKTKDITHVFDVFSGRSRAGRGFQVAPRGYGGFINMVVGISAEGRVLEVTVISHNETPGLGSAAAEPKFLDQFKGEDPSVELVVNKNVDAVSGATKSSKAITKGVNEALEGFKKTEGK
jgi:electron transport complex protein RnfG